MTAPGTELTVALALADAAGHARRGGYGTALRLLDESTVDGPELWDLRARIHAQRGDLAAADAAWQRVLDARPDDAAALAGRRLIAQIRRGRRRRRPLAPVLLPAAVVLVLLAGGAVATGAALGSDSSPAAPATGTAAHEGLRDRVHSLESRRARRRAAAERARRRLTDLADSLRGKDVRVIRQEHDVQVVFRSGLFPPDGTELTPAGRRILARWGRKLAGQQVRVTVLGHEALLAGESVNGGSLLEVSRAEAAAGALAAASRLPLSTFTVTGAEQSAAPYPGRGTAAQSRDRTVTLLVTPA